MALLAAFMLAVFPNFVYSLEETISFPEIPGWNKGEVTTTELETPSGDQGSWSELTYSRETDRHSILVVVLKGPGTSWSGLPKGNVSAKDGPIGSGATYRTTTILNFPAVLEIHPLTGSSLVVTPSEDTTFTFEAAFEDVDLEWFAENFLKDLNFERQ